MEQMPPGMASVNGRPPVPVEQAVDEVVNMVERKLGGRRRKPEVEATVSVNGGPHVPLDQLKDALHIIKGRAAREAAAGQPQRDLEEATGVAPRQRQREAEAGGIAGDRLRSLVDRIERLEEERKALASDIKDIFSEAKSAGFDVKAVRQVIRMRKWEPADLAEHEALVELYRRALGM
jgi:uncharacterized protein (UPF0335 family)